MDVVYKGGRSCRLDETESLPYEMFSASTISGRLYDAPSLNKHCRSHHGSWQIYMLEAGIRKIISIYRIA